MHQTITVSSQQREQLIDITDNVKAIVKQRGSRYGRVSVYVQGATAASMIASAPNIAT